MNNEAIILQNMEILIRDGVITANNVIHTYQRWKSLGYQVKKGETAIAKFPIWKYTNERKEDMTEEEAQQCGYCFKKNSSWFSDSQVTKI